MGEGDGSVHGSQDSKVIHESSSEGEGEGGWRKSTRKKTVKPKKSNLTPHYKNWDGWKVERGEGDVSVEGWRSDLEGDTDCEDDGSWKGESSSGEMARMSEDEEFGVKDSAMTDEDSGLELNELPALPKHRVTVDVLLVFSTIHSSSIHLSLCPSIRLSISSAMTTTIDKSVVTQCFGKSKENSPHAAPSQPTNQPTSQPTSQPAGRPASQPTSQPASQPAMWLPA